MQIESASVKVAHVEESPASVLPSSSSRAVFDSLSKDLLKAAPSGFRDVPVASKKNSLVASLCHQSTLGVWIHVFRPFAVDARVISVRIRSNV